MERALYHFDKYENLSNNSILDSIYANSLQLYGNYEIKKNYYFPLNFSLSFDGISGYGLISHNVSLEFYKNLSIEFTYKCLEKANKTILYKENAYKIEINTSGNIIFSIYADSVYNSVTSINTVDLNNIYKLKFIYNGYKLFLYIDGIMDNFIELVGYINNSTSNTLIASNGVNFLKCEIGEFVIKDIIDDPVKIFNNSYEKYSQSSVLGTQNAQSLVQGFKTQYSYPDPYDLWKDGMKQMIDIFNNPNIALDIAYTNNFIDVFYNNISKYIAQTNCLWNNGYYADGFNNEIITVNLIPFIYPVNISTFQTQTWNISSFIFAEQYKNISLNSNAFYSIDGGNSWISVNNSSYTNIGRTVTDFRLKILLNSNANSSTTAYIGWALQIFNP